MLKPLEISFHGLDRSDAVEARIREKFGRIEQHFDRITHARVAVRTPARRGAVPKMFHVKIEIGMAGHAPIIVDYEPNPDRAQTDVMLALREAFAIATRQVDDYVSRKDKPARREKARRRPAKAVLAEDA